MLGWFVELFAGDFDSDWATSWLEHPKAISKNNKMIVQREGSVMALV